MSVLSALKEQASLQVDGLDWRRVRLPLRTPLHHASASRPYLESVVVRLRANGSTSYAEVRGNGEYATGEDTRRILGGLETLRLPASAADAVSHLEGKSRLAAMAVDVASWNLLAGRKGQPLYRYFGGAPTRGWPTHGQIFLGTPDQAALDARNLAGQGFRRLKIRVGSPDHRADVERVRAVRSAVGQAVELLVDANGGWDTKQALEAAEGFARLGVTWLEQPVLHPTKLALVAKSSAVPIRADESATDAASILRLVELGGLSGVHLKLEKCGSLAGLIAAADAARNNGLDVAFGQMDQGRLGCAATTQVAAGLGFEEAELWGCANVDPADDIAGPLELQDGQVLLADRPGLGVDVRFDPPEELA
jgi:L-alanine-DL-glutamate epimerase-like enolase superfamily enzyme